ncbi:MAG: hypothetical protein HRT95_05835 [Moritella sp.]|uniref:hypothetical protein n=1 Tax=Moritella sp. TaxID=78556 RepID=UPI001D1DE1F6|nr:hypothetical protein [Moritella sp.]NQZ49712.1 hypothetical protein [Moritella sp.]
MSKLLKLKKWLTLDDAALHITGEIKDTVTVTDLYLAALEGKLKLSVYFVNNAHGITGELCNVGDIENQLAQQTFDIKDRTVHSMEGIWDLTMQGQEALEVKGYFEQSNSGISVTALSKNGILLQQDDITCQLYKYFDRDKIFNPKYNESEERRRAIAEEPMRVLENDPSIVTPSIRRSKYGLEFVPCHKFSEVGGVLIIIKSEVAHFIELLGGTPQEAKPPAQKTYTKNSDKQKYNKRITQDRYAAWQKQANKIKKLHPNASKTWISEKIAKLPIAEGKSAGRIRKIINI